MKNQSKTKEVNKVLRKLKGYSEKPFIKKKPAPKSSEQNLYAEFESEDQEYCETFAGVDIEAEFNRKKTPDEEAEMLEYQQAAKNFLKKDARVNFRISQHDLNLLKHKANMEGMPYQTMLGSLVHKFVNNII